MLDLFGRARCADFACRVQAQDCRSARNQARIDRSQISVIEVEEPRDLWLTCWLIHVWCSILPSASHCTVCESGIHVFHCQTVLFIMHVLSIFVQASLCVVAGRCET